MLEYQTSVILGQPIEAVFNFLTTAANEPPWLEPLIVPCSWHNSTQVLSA